MASHLSNFSNSFKNVGSKPILAVNSTPALRPNVPMRTVATHDGQYHWDECLAIWFVRQLPEYINSTIVRTRNAEELEKADLVLDVGGVYDFEKSRFDHHMKEFTLCFSKEFSHITLSSAGLVYFHYGRDLLKQLLENFRIEPADLEWLYHYAYKNYVCAVDAIDNGVDAAFNPDGSKPMIAYKDPSTLADKIRRTYIIAGDDGFRECYKAAGRDFSEWLHFVAMELLPERLSLKKAIASRYTVHPSGRVIKLDKFIDYDTLLPDLEKFHFHLSDGDNSSILFTVYPSSGDASKETPWRIKTVANTPGGFHFRMGLKEEWRGLRDDALEAISHIRGLVFVHRTGFMAALATEDACMETIGALMDGVPFKAEDQ